MKAFRSARFHAACWPASREVMAARSASESWEPAPRLTACCVRPVTETPRTTSAIKTLEFIELPLVSAERYRKGRDARTGEGAAAGRPAPPGMATRLVPGCYWA